MEKAGLYADQFQGRAPQEALLMLSKAPHKGFGSSSSLDVINQANALRKQVGQLYCPAQVGAFLPCLTIKNSFLQFLQPMEVMNPLLTIILIHRSSLDLISDKWLYMAH